LSKASSAVRKIKYCKEVLAVYSKQKIMTQEELKQNILAEIQKNEFPNLAFLYEQESLKLFPEILQELLIEEKEKFQKIISTPKEELKFSDFQDFDELKYLFMLLNHIDMVDKSEITQKIIEDFEPLYTDFSNEMTFSLPYYERICYVLENETLDSEQTRILELEKKNFELAWINLEKDIQEEIKKINLELAKLSLEFQNNIVASKNKFFYHISSFDSIKELPEATLENARKRAEKEKKTWYIFDADPTAFWDIMEYCQDENIRKDFSEARNQFATESENDNTIVVLQILKLKEQKAKLMGYNNFAEVSLSTKMAKEPKVVFELLEWITQKAREKAQIEIEELKNHFGLSKLQSWDSAYYSRKLKEEKYGLDEKELKKYFEYENVKSYLFDFISCFYGVEMKQINVKTYHPDALLFKVYKEEKLISYYLLDPFYRSSKRPWAWADNPRGRFGEKVPFIVNVCNFQKQNGQTLLTMRDVETLFHEFGHALHEMLSESRYSDLSGFNVEWDFVELPSQIHENWVGTRESLEKLGKHFETGEKIPNEMLDTLDTLKTYMSGLFTLRQNEFALLDMKLYSQKAPETVQELDKNALEIANSVSIFKREENYKMYASFGHIFGWWYAAWYYSYMWAEILEADVFERIYELWMFDRNVGEKFISTILWQGTKKEASELFKDFMGRELSSVAFMKRKWFM